MKLRHLLREGGITQAEVARGIRRTDGYVSLLVNGETGASQATIKALLAFLSRRLGRAVTYEELFGPSAPDLVVPSEKSA